VGRDARAFISGGRDCGGGTSNRGKVDTVFKSTLADLSSSSAVLLRSDTGASGKLGLVSRFFLVGDGLSLLVEGIVSDEILFIDITPVVTACATLAEAFVHASLGLGSVLDYGAGGEGTFGAGHDGRWGAVKVKSYVFVLEITPT